MQIKILLRLEST